MAIDKIQSESINLTDDFAFTGTVTGAGGNNVPAFFAISTSTEDNTNVSDNTWTKKTLSTEVYDTDGKYTSSRFTPTVAGKYFVYAKAILQNTISGSEERIAIYKNGSDIGEPYRSHFRDGNSANAGFHNHTLNITIDLDTDDYVEMYIYKNDGGNTGGSYDAYFGAYKIIT